MARQTFMPFSQAGTQTGTQKLNAILKQHILGAWRQSCN